MTRLELATSASLTRRSSQTEPHPEVTSFQNASSIIHPGGIKVKALFDAEMKWRLIEDFGPDCFTVQEDGRLLFTSDYSDLENLVVWLRTFGDQAEVLEPDEAREQLRISAERIIAMYRKDKQ